MLASVTRNCGKPWRGCLVAYLPGSPLLHSLAPAIPRSVLPAHPPPATAPSNATPQVDRLEASVEPSWEGLVQPLERIVDRLSRAWGTVSHLKAVKDTEELRKVGNSPRLAGRQEGCAPHGHVAGVWHWSGAQSLSLRDNG